MQNSLNCIPNAGGRLLVDTNVTNFNQSAILVSPLYNRSRDWYSDCLKISLYAAWAWEEDTFNLLEDKNLP